MKFFWPPILGWISKAHIDRNNVSLTHPEGIHWISVSFCRVGSLHQGWRWTSWPKLQDGELATIPGGGKVNLNTWILRTKINIHFQSESRASYEYGLSVVVTILRRNSSSRIPALSVLTYHIHLTYVLKSVPSALLFPTNRIFLKA